MGPASFVEITNREIYDGLNEVRGEVRALRIELTGVLDDKRTVHARLRALELRYYGVLAGLVGTLGAVGLSLAGAV